MGEIGLAGVVDRQLAAPDGAVLFSSAINQHAYPYKMMLFDKVKPEVIAIGSSRAMQVKGQFFSAGFINLGGATNNIAELELLAGHLAAAKPLPRLVFLILDPWWFNDRYPDSTAVAQIPDFAKIISVDLVWEAAKGFRHGNWIAKSFKSHDLGIYALLADEGFSRDGSFNYVGILTGEHPSTDVKFSDTLARIAGDSQRFQKNSQPDPALVSRMCRVVASLKKSAGHLVVIAPPFSNAVWHRMMQGGYGYIAKANAALRACSPETEFFDFGNPASVAGSTECEFVDGFHGGDVTYARMLSQIAAADPETRKYLRTGFVKQFIERYRDHAGGGMNLEIHPSLKEVDFLKLGCRK